MVFIAKKPLFLVLMKTSQSIKIQRLGTDSYGSMKSKLIQDDLFFAFAKN